MPRLRVGQVENSHDTNMREEGDDRHAQNLAILKHLVDSVDGVMSDMRGMRRDIGRLADADVKHDTRIRDIEQTHPPKGTIE